MLLDQALAITRQNLSKEVMKLQEEALKRGARAGVIAGCNEVGKSQVENMLSLLVEYSYPMSLNVLLLFIAYQAGRKKPIIPENVAKVIVNDLLELRNSVEINLDKTLNDTNNLSEFMDELLRTYLGALKWTYTAAAAAKKSNDKSTVCQYIQTVSTKIPSVSDIVKKLLDA